MYILTKVLFCVVIARAVVPEFVVRIHPVAFVVQILKPNNSKKNKKI